MSIRLIAFDLDGTFLDDRKNCIRENIEAITEAAARGVYIVPCSGRMYLGIPEEIRRLDFIRYVIAINGADVRDVRTGERIYRAEIPMETAERVYDYLDTLPVIYDCYQDGEGFIDRVFYERADEIVEDPVVLGMVRSLRSPVDGFRGFLRERYRPLQKIQVMFKDMELRGREIRRVGEMFPECVVTTSLYNNLEINARGADKGAGLRALCRHLGLDAAETMALGDGGNDVTMLEAAGLGVAMGNAPEEVKACAGAVVGTNEEAGVAEAVRRFVLSGER